MKTTIVDGKEIPVIEPAEVKTTITNKKTGENNFCRKDKRTRVITGLDLGSY